MVYNREKMAAAMRGIMEVMLGVILVGFVDHVKLSLDCLFKENLYSSKVH